MALAASNVMPSGQRHVPAWKRIGLKLKYAKDSAEIHSLEPHTPENSGIATGDHVRPPKKRKIDAGSVRNEEDSKTTRSAGDSIIGPDLNSENAHQSIDENNENGTLTNPATRRKSVSFTPETKQADGFGPPELLQQSDAEIAVIEQPATSTKPSKKKEKKRTSSVKSSTDSSLFNSIYPSGGPGERDQPSTDVHIPEYVRYLYLFDTDKASWKFNKKKQTDLLKNFFDVRAIPSTLNSAALEYISGLQGDAAQRRLVDRATAVLAAIAGRYSDETARSMESEEARREAYFAALQRQTEKFERSGHDRSEYNDQQIDEMRQDYERRKRAEAVGQLLQKELHPEQNLQVSTPNDDTRINSQAPPTSDSTKEKKAKRNKRKSRTQGASDSESEGDFNPSRGPATVHDALSARSDPKPNVEAVRVARAPSTKSTGTKKIFDDELLDDVFPKKRSYKEVVPKRKPGQTRGFAETHGTKVDSSSSEDEGE